MSTDETQAMPVAARDACRSCGSGDRAEAHYVASPLTGRPVTCTDDWHDEDAAGPGAQKTAEDDHEPTLVSVPAFTPGGWDLTTQLPAPCRCGMCPESQEEPSGLALLSYAPGVIARMHDARVRNGQWDDIPALFDEAHGDVHKPAIKAQRNIGRALNDGYGHLSLVFSCHPEWRTDAALAEGLRTKADELAADLDDMRRAAASREAELRQRAAERRHAAELERAA